MKTLRYGHLFWLVSLIYLTGSAQVHATEGGENISQDWVGSPSEANWNIGVLAGEVSGTSPDVTTRFTPVISVSRSLFKSGLLPAINNKLSLELRFGPLIESVGSAFFYASHFKLDFIKNSSWSFSAVIGIAGKSYSDPALASYNFDLEAGLGLTYRPFKNSLGIRFEISNQFSAAGVTMDL